MFSLRIHFFSWLYAFFSLPNCLLLTDGFEFPSDARIDLGPDPVFEQNVVIEEIAIVEGQVAPDQACKYNKYYCMSCN